MPTPEDERLALLLRAIRREAKLRQADLAAAARVPRRDIQRIESGRAGEVQVDRVRRTFASAGGRLTVQAWWRGAAADRLLDERHASLVERAVRIFRRRGWQAEVEVSFSEFGERGSVDILAGNARAATVAVCEVKATLGSLEELNRTLDVKERLAPRMARARFGWLPRAVGRLLIVPSESTIRRVIDRHGATMAAIYPARSREVRAWLHAPDGALRGIWFLSDAPDADLDSA